MRSYFFPSVKPLHPFPPSPSRVFSSEGISNKSDFSQVSSLAVWRERREGMVILCLNRHVSNRERIGRLPNTPLLAPPPPPALPWHGNAAERRHLRESCERSMCARTCMHFFTQQTTLASSHTQAAPFFCSDSAGIISKTSRGIFFSSFLHAGWAKHHS